MREPTEDEIQAMLKAHMEDPEVIRDLEVSLKDVRRGRVLPWRIALLPLPRWVFWILFAVAPVLPVGRLTRRLSDRTQGGQE